MANSNSVFFGINDSRPYQNNGYEIIVKSVKDDFTTVLAVIPDYIELAFTVEINGVGAGSITLDKSGPPFTSNLLSGDSFSELLTHRHLWQIWDNGVLIADFIRTQTTEEDEEGKKTVTISGPGGATTLANAAVLPPNTGDEDGSYFWSFDSGPTMSHFITLLTAAQDRGTSTYIDLLFTSSLDSGGAAWSDSSSTAEFKPDLGTNLLDLLDILTGNNTDQQNVTTYDWRMWPGFKLDVRPVIGSRRENYVIFYESEHMSSKSLEEDSTEVANYVVARDEYGGVSIASDSASVDMYGQIELLEQRSNISKPSIRDQIASVILQLKKNSIRSWTVSVPPSSVGREVFKDYNVGDWVGFVTYINGVPTKNVYRVVAISIRDRGIGGRELELTLESKFDEESRRLKRKLDSLVGSVGNGTIPSLGDVYIPRTPLDNSPFVWDTDLGKWVAGDPSLFGGGVGTGQPPVTYQVDEPDTDTVPIGYLWLQKTAE